MPRRIVIADQDAVDQFPHGVQRVLGVLGHPEALVTDESQVGDFLMHYPSDPECARLEKEGLAELSSLLGRPVTRRDWIWELARDLEAQGQRPSLQ
jgi:hypothetical protein